MATACASVFSVTCETKVSLLTTLEHRRKLEEILEDYHPGFKVCVGYRISIQCPVSPNGPWFDVDTNILLGE